MSCSKMITKCIKSVRKVRESTAWRIYWIQFESSKYNRKLEFSIPNIYLIYLKLTTERTEGHLYCPRNTKHTHILYTQYWNVQKERKQTNKKWDKTQKVNRSEHWTANMKVNVHVGSSACSGMQTTSLFRMAMYLCVCLCCSSTSSLRGSPASCSLFTLRHSRKTACTANTHHACILAL